MEPSTPESPHCLDCGTQLHGRYCSRCGQRHEEHNLGLKHVLEEVLHDILHFDSRFFLTLKLLLFKPGKLTCEYLEGKRARYLPPFRLYIFISFLLFLLLGISTGIGKGHETGTGPQEATFSWKDDESSPSAKPEQTAETKREASRPSKIELIKKGALKAKENPEEFKERLFHWISRVMFLLLPAFAALLLLIFMGSGKYFVEHVIFSLHFHAFIFTIFIAEWALAKVPWGEVETFGAWLTLLIPIHLALSLRRVYGGSFWKILIKGAFLSGIYLVLVGATLLGTLLWVLAH